MFTIAQAPWHLLRPDIPTISFIVALVLLVLVYYGFESDAMTLITRRYSKYYMYGQVSVAIWTLSGFLLGIFLVELGMVITSWWVSAVSLYMLIGAAMKKISKKKEDLLYGFLFCPSLAFLFAGAVGVLIAIIGRCAIWAA